MARFDTRLKLSEIRGGDRLDLAADETERAAIRERLGLAALDRLDAHVALDRDGDTIRATGRVRASVAQPCVATGEPVEALVDEPFALTFCPAPGQAPAADEEVELGADDLDMVFHDGQQIALGDALVDTLSLALDPYPRSAGADAALKAAGVLSEAEAGPFAALAALKDGMKK